MPEEDEFSDFEAAEESASAGFENVDLVDLIELPAWKAILIDLVKSEKMNPWDIDLVQLADRYLHKIGQMEHSNLRVPANAILASAILLKMKARTIKLTPLDDDEEHEAHESEIRMLDGMIPELRGTRVQRDGKVTLDELVSGIEEILEKSRKRTYILREMDIPEFKFGFDMQDINARMEEVFSRITENADSQGLILFSALLKEKTPQEMVDVFIPLLFLMNKGRINAWQDEFFGEIFIALQK